MNDSRRAEAADRAAHNAAERQYMRKSVVERTAVLPKFSTLWQRVVRAKKWVRPVNRADGDEMGD